VKATIPFATIAALDFPLALLGQQANASIRDDQGLIMVLREAWYALGYHLGLVSLVQTPCVKHIPQHWPPHFTPEVDLLPVAWGMVLGLLVWRLEEEQRRLAGAAIFWMVVAYLPSSNVIPLSRFVADVYVYLPLAGLGWLLGAWLDTAIAHTQRRWPAGAVLVVVALILAALTLPSSARWRNSIALWADGFAQNPHEYRMCRNLGNAYNQAGEYAIALDVYQTCAGRFGSGPFAKNIAITLAMQGRHGEALQQFEQLATQYPDDPVIQRYLNMLRQPK
ncbi:MAG: tetratricopeptide repeat protein, partial [Myxococcota bacterium]